MVAEAMTARPTQSGWMLAVMTSAGSWPAFICRRQQGEQPRSSPGRLVESNVLSSSRWRLACVDPHGAQVVLAGRHGPRPDEGRPGGRAARCPDGANCRSDDGVDRVRLLRGEIVVFNLGQRHVQGAHRSLRAGGAVAPIGPTGPASSWPGLGHGNGRAGRPDSDDNASALQDFAHGLQRSRGAGCCVS